MMGSERVELINSSGCSRLFVGTFSASQLLKKSPNKYSETPMSSASMAISEPAGSGAATGPFAGLIICVTGLSKEARKQVMAATERLGGLYSASLHPQCTHLVVQSFGGRKIEHALKHGLRNGLLVVSLGWFVDSVRRNVRLSESLYSVKNVGGNGLLLGENHLAGYTGSEKSCLPVKLYEDNKSSGITWQAHLHLSGKESRRSRESVLADDCIYIDSNISTELKIKVVDAVSREGAVLLDHWFIGCQASHVVCEGPYIQNYIGHTNNLVTPMWILKTLKEKYVQRLVHLSTDLARQVAMMLENVQGKNDQTANPVATNSREYVFNSKTIKFLEERQKLAKLAKMGVRNRRDRRMQFVRTPIRPINPSSLLDAVCWSISEPTSSACTYTDSSVNEDASEPHASVFFDARGDGRDSEASFDNNTRPLRESEKREVIFKNHFLTILFPIDRFGELGPSSKTFFSDGGFTCLQVLDYIFSFYQESMSLDEIDVAIHTDSRHADRLRSLYASKESQESGFIPYKRIEFLGSRKSFEALKRVSGENNINVYELLIRA